MTQDSVRDAIRTFVISTLALFIPGVLGWLNELTQWARAEGDIPFPDGRSLVFLGVSAITAGVIAVINLAWNLVEDATGKGMLRSVPAPRRRRGEAGRYDPLYVAVLVLVVVVILILVL